MRNALSNNAIRGFDSTAAVGISGFVAMLAAVVAHRIYGSRSRLTLNLIAIGFAATAGFCGAGVAAPNALLAASRSRHLVLRSA